MDRQRKKKGSNHDWTHPHDPDAKITKMKDGRTHLAHKAEQAVDLETGAVLAVTLEGAGAGDTTTLAETVIEAAEQLAAVAENKIAKERLAAGGLQELVADKGYHSNEVLEDLAALEIRSYISEPDRGRRRWRNKAAAQAAVYGNRRRIRGERGKRLLRQRGERVERSFAHLYETGRMRRTHLRGHPNILKRLLLHIGAFNLSLVLRKKLGAGTPRGLAALKKALGRSLERFFGVCGAVLMRCRPSCAEIARHSARPRFAIQLDSPPELLKTAFSATGC
jgi:transposase